MYMSVMDSTSQLDPMVSLRFFVVVSDETTALAASIAIKLNRPLQLLPTKKY
ncbi:hypothetical protein CFII64_26723 [Pseudomonas sp. CFII64]|nr:hypothetical protein CFII64_26723 [Pseudomonas sp. CFII64]